MEKKHLRLVFFGDYNSPASLFVPLPVFSVEQASVPFNAGSYGNSTS